MEEVVHMVIVRIAKWVPCRSDFDRLRVDGLLCNWEASLHSGISKKNIALLWCSSIQGVLKFNVDGAVTPIDFLNLKSRSVLQLCSKFFFLPHNQQSITTENGKHYVGLLITVAMRVHKPLLQLYQEFQMVQ